MDRVNLAADLRGGGPQELVLRFEDGNALHEHVDALLQHLDLLPDGEHEVALDEVHRLLDLVVDRHRAAPRGTKNKKENPQFQCYITQTRRETPRARRYRASRAEKRY